MSAAKAKLRRLEEVLAGRALWGASTHAFVPAPVSSPLPFPVPSTAAVSTAAVLTPAAVEWKKHLPVAVA